MPNVADKIPPVLSLARTEASTADDRPTLLMVEDDRGLQKQMRWSFDDYEIVFAEDRDSAIAALRRCEPAVMTLDLGLPPNPDTTEEGFRILQEVLSLAPATKVIALTGQNDRANAVRAIGIGAYDFFAKPFEAEILGLVIARAFRVAELLSFRFFTPDDPDPRVAVLSGVQAKKLAGPPA